MKLAILETGRPPGDLAEQFGDYPEMFARLLGGDFEIRTFDAQARELPEDPAAYDAYLITGSPAGVYEPLPWIADLLAFIRSAEHRKMVGICFGHQAMAQALGGQVEKSHKGWSVGLQRYYVQQRKPWMDDAKAVAIPASHQDQVVEQPPNSVVTVASDFAPFAGLSYSDRPAISFQFHPEFNPDYAKALIAHRRKDLPEPDAAMASLDRPNDRRRVGDWITAFLKS